MSYALQAIYHSEDVEPNYPALPDGTKRHHVEEILLEVSRAIGLSSSLLRTFLTMIKQTRPSDWTSTTTEPVCFVQQNKLARMLDKSERQVRNDEADLCRMKLITKHVSGNGARGCVKHSDGSAYRQGIVFTPLIEAFEELVKLREDRANERATFQTVKRHCSALRRNIKSTVTDLLPENPRNASLIDLAKTMESWAHGYGHFKTLQALREHHDELVAHSQQADDLRQIRKNISGQPAVDDRPYIQDTTENLIVSCNTHVDKRTACLQADTESLNTKPDGSVDCLENKCEAASVESNSKFLSELSPWRLKSLCSDEMRFYLEYHQGERAAPSAMDFIRAAIDRVPQLGISNSAYRDAVTQMNDMATALCILIIDRNRFHPVTPVRNPGGALRAMTRRHALGKLNLTGGLIGLSERTKVDLQ